MNFELIVNYKGKEYVRMSDVLGQAKELGFTKKYIKESLEANKIKGLGNGLFVSYEEVKNFLAVNSNNDIDMGFEESVKEGGSAITSYYLMYKFFTIKNGMKRYIYDGREFNCKYRIGNTIDEISKYLSEPLYNLYTPNEILDKYGFSNEKERNIVIDFMYKIFNSNETIKKQEDLNSISDKQWSKLEQDQNDYWSEFMGLNTSFNKGKFNEDILKEFLNTGYKQLAKKYHPDVQGAGDNKKFMDLQFIKDNLLVQYGL